MLISDELYMFVRGMENEVTKVLTINFLIAYCGEDVRQVILEKFIGKQYPQNLAFLIQRTLELFARKICKFLKI